MIAAALIEWRDVGAFLAGVGLTLSGMAAWRRARNHNGKDK